MTENPHNPHTAPPADESIVPRSAVAVRADVENRLSIDEEKAKQLQLDQQRLRRLYHSRARLSPADYARARGMELEAHHRQTGNNDALAEALAQQGRYSEAAAVAENPDLRAQMLSYLSAVEKPDDDCACDSIEIIEDFAVPTQNVEFYGYSEKHGAVVPFIRCRKCNDLNARANLPHLVEQKRERDKAVAGKTPNTDFFKVNK